MMRDLVVAFEREAVAVGATFGDARTQPVRGVVDRQTVEQRGGDDLVVFTGDREREVGGLDDRSERLRRGDHVAGERPQTLDPFEIRVAVVRFGRQVRNAGRRGELRRVVQLQPRVGERLGQTRIDCDGHG